MAPFERTLQAGWVQIDANGHLRNTAFMDIAVDVRLMYLDSRGFGMSQMTGHAIGPVVRRDEIEFFREVRLLEPVRITCESAGMSEDGSRFMFRNDFFRGDGELAARLTSLGGWLDLRERKLTAPPPILLAAMQALERTPDFKVLNSSLRRSD